MLHLLRFVKNVDVMLIQELINLESVSAQKPNFKNRSYIYFYITVTYKRFNNNKLNLITVVCINNNDDKCFICKKKVSKRPCELVN